MPPEMLGQGGPQSDPTNQGGRILPDEEQQWDVPTGYALLADVPLPPVLRGEDLEG